MNMQLRAALDDPSSSARLQAALSAGTYPDASYIETLIEQCAIEPDFYVRDMLTWALTRHPAALAVPLLVEQIATREGQARSQALHTLSKIGDPAGWAAITPELLRAADDEVARTAWRAAVALVPAEGREELAAILASQLGRGARQVQLSLSRALASLAEEAYQPLHDALAHASPKVRIHAVATQRQIDDPDEGFDASVFEAERIVVLGSSPDQPAN